MEEMPTFDRPKAFSYVRFSTPEQARGDSLRRQLTKAEDYARSHGLDLVDDAYMDQGISAYRGRNKNDGALADFLQAVEDGVVEKGSYLLVESMDRLSREKPRKAVRLLEDICEGGITLVTLADSKEYTSETLDADPMSFMWAFMVAIRANEESETKSKRVREAWGRKKVRARDDKLPITRRTPAWLTLRDSTYEVLGDRASVILRIFKDADKGIGQHAIAQRLNAEGVEPFGDGSRKAAFWHRSYVSKLLSNPAVIGTFTPHETREVSGKKVRDALAPIPDYFPPIVPQALFDRIQVRQQGRNAPRMRADREEVSNVLAGLAKCPLCGSTMTRVNKGRKGGTPYLVCTKAKSGARCEYKQVKLGLVEAAIRHAGTRELVHVVPSGDTDIDRRILEAQRDWDGITGAIANITEEIAAGNKSPALRRSLSEYEHALAEVEARQEELNRLASRGNKRAIARVVKGLEEAFGNPKSTVTNVNTALRDAFTHVIVDHRQGTLDFYWKQGGEPTSISYDLPVEG
ncbi:recombinase family protein [Mesorhizobium sp. 1B3]|uniref:recombinase family protein n=1 Tax=Mesorhizobium sp. 1B3 TaxID=3243599 RepID=UPI003D970393